MIGRASRPPMSQSGPAASWAIGSRYRCGPGALLPEGTRSGPGRLPGPVDAAHATPRLGDAPTPDGARVHQYGEHGSDRLLPELDAPRETLDGLPRSPRGQPGGLV